MAGHHQVHLVPAKQTLQLRPAVGARRGQARAAGSVRGAASGRWRAGRGERAGGWGGRRAACRGSKGARPEGSCSSGASHGRDSHWHYFVLFLARPALGALTAGGPPRRGWTCAGTRSTCGTRRRARRRDPCHRPGQQPGRARRRALACPRAASRAAASRRPPVRPPGTRSHGAVHAHHHPGRAAAVHQLQIPLQPLRAHQGQEGWRGAREAAASGSFSHCSRVQARGGPGRRLAASQAPSSGCWRWRWRARVQPGARRSQARSQVGAPPTASRRAPGTGGCPAPGRARC